MLPPEPGAIVVPGKWNVPQSKVVASSTTRPYHHEPDNIIGALPLMNVMPMSSALMPETSFEM